MQRWQVYIKWNEKLFHEVYDAYNRNGRSSSTASEDPTEYWYEGELGFFDNYILPLVRKLKDCGIFGSDDDNDLEMSALANRREWQSQGKQLVGEYLSRYQQHQQQNEESNT